MRLLQIYEGDLVELEHILPQLATVNMVLLDNRQRAQWRRVQHILKNVRWNYGPPEQIEKISAGTPEKGDEESQPH